MTVPSRGGEPLAVGPGRLSLLPAGAALLLAVTYHLAALSDRSSLLLSLDDGYLHLRLAENLAATGHLGVNPGEPTGGTSSLLWTATLALLRTFGLPTEPSALVLGLGSLFLAIAALTRVAFRLLPPGPALAAATFAALGGQNAALALTGMETLLAAAMVLFAFAAHASGRRRATTVWLVLACFVRVEAALAALSMALVDTLGASRAGGSFAEPRGGPARRFLVALAAATSAVALLAILGHGFPSTLAGRRWLYGLGERFLTSQDPLLPTSWAFLRTSVERLAWAIGPGGPLRWVWALAALGFAGAGACALWPRSATGRSLLLWLVLQFLFVFLGLGSDGQLGRYLEPVWLSLPLLVVAGCGKARDLLPRPLGRIALWGAVAFLAILYVPQGVHWARWHRASIHHLASVHRKMAEAVAELVPAGETVAAVDVGLLSLRSGHRVVDIGGLSGLGTVRAMYARAVPQLLEREGVHYVVLPEKTRSRTRYTLAERLGFDVSRMREVTRFALPAERQEHLVPARTALPSLTLYALD